MGIFNELKRMYLRYKNSDPYYSCEYFNKEGCNMVDGLYCNFPNCNIRLKYLGNDFVFCPDCVEYDDCLSGKFGIGCYIGKKCNECKNGKKMNKVIDV